MLIMGPEQVSLLSEHQSSGPDAVEVSPASSQAGTPGERGNRREGGGEEKP